MRFARPLRSHVRIAGRLLPALMSGPATELVEHSGGRSPESACSGCRDKRQV